MQFALIFFLWYYRRKYMTNHKYIWLNILRPNIRFKDSLFYFNRAISKWVFKPIRSLKTDQPVHVLSHIRTFVLYPVFGFGSINVLTGPEVLFRLSGCICICLKTRFLMAWLITYNFLKHLFTQWLPFLLNDISPAKIIFQWTSYYIVISD